MYSLNNMKSYTNLKRWAAEISSVIKGPSTSGDTPRDISSNSSTPSLRQRQRDGLSSAASGQCFYEYKLPVPTLVVGNKSDLSNAKQKQEDGILNTSAAKGDIDWVRWTVFLCVFMVCHRFLSCLTQERLQAFFNQVSTAKS